MDNRPSSFNRRHLLRLAAAGSLAAVPALGLVRSSSAALRWCRLDPVFLIDGMVASVYVSSRQGSNVASTGPIQLIFAAPEQVSVELLSSDEGFGYGYDVQIVADPKLKSDDKQMDLAITVTVPTDLENLIRVEFVPDGTVKDWDLRIGNANKAIRVKTRLKR
ncbi:MAG: hypothetical protein ACR2OO_07900 [Thermomicrobiales bacterium]